MRFSKQEPVDGAAKELLLQFFDVLGPDSEATRKGRARLTNLLFV